MDRTVRIRINGDLRGTPEVRVIAADGTMLGVMRLSQALRLAMKEGLDLVEVNPKADPPVCRILDFSKHTHEEKKNAARAELPNNTDLRLRWTAFECDGRSFEYIVAPAKQKVRPAGWPSHKPSPGPLIPMVVLTVRNVGDETGPGIVFPERTVVTMEHAIEAVRKFWHRLTK